MSYYILKESKNDWFTEWYCIDMISAIQKLRQTIRISNTVYKLVKGEKYKYFDGECYLEIIER